MMRFDEHTELQLHHQRAEELQAAAEKRRLLASCTPPSIRHVLGTFVGRRLVALGEHLQAPERERVAFLTTETRSAHR